MRADGRRLLLFIGAGIALAKATATGTSPISCIPAVLTEICIRYDLPHISLGVFSFLFNALLLLGEIVLLRGKVKPTIFLQLIPLAVMTVSIDVWAIPFDLLPLDTYLSCLIALFVSVVFMSIGVFLEVDADVLAVPGDEFVKVLAQVSGEPFSVIKTTFDCSLMAFSASLSLMLLEGLFGVREGTVVNAMLVGIFLSGFGVVCLGAKAASKPLRKQKLTPCLRSRSRRRSSTEKPAARSQGARTPDASLGV